MTRKSYHTERRGNNRGRRDGNDAGRNEKLRRKGNQVGRKRAWKGGYQ